MKYILTILVITSCATSNDSSELPNFDPLTPYEYYVTRLDHFSEDGWIVSRKTNGDPAHVGDSLIWTGIAMGSLPCKESLLYQDRMIKMIEDNKGALVRYEPLGEYEGGREVSFDGATGLYFGILRMILECKAAESWVGPWKLHTDYVKRNYGYLNANTSEAVNPEFTVLADYISHRLNQRGEPDGSRVSILETQIASWAYGVKVKKAACFRIHLGWLYLKSLDRLGKLSKSGKSKYCGATKDTDIPLIDHFCGRRHISHWEFKENEWEYRHQRCGKWETPDGDGLSTPGLDLIVAYKEVLND